MPGPVHLRGGGVSVLVAPSPAGVPVLLHWGADLGDVSSADLSAYPALRAPGVPHSALDEPRWTSVLPENGAGFTGTPAIEGHHLDSHGGPWAPQLRAWQWESDAGSVSLVATDEEAALTAEWQLEVTPEGLVRVRSTLTNSAPETFVVSALRNSLPVPASASELVDLTGRWSGERAPQRHPWPQGLWLRNSRHGRTGHDATLLLMAGDPGFGFRSGQVWGVHVAWSGDHTTYAERTAEGECLLGGAELLGPGEIVLNTGESYTTPWLVGACSDEGIDGLSERLHRWVRRHAPRPRRTRPVVVNTWEATYFDHDLGKLTALADAAAEVGAERYVLDDGWFQGRRTDRAGLGDWLVDPDVWPEGLHPLVDHVQARGMEFGLWVEPEMVNEDSDLARKHPDWILRGREQLPGTWRHQQVLDLQHPDAYAHLHGALLALLDEYDIAFLKWDHNRDLIDAAHRGRPVAHGQTVAFYRLLDELRAAHPEVEIESCASGGARIDLEVLTRTDRVWTSDTLDPLLRSRIQRWTSVLVPPDIMGAHVGGPVAHTTGRVSRLGFRAAVALLGHFGIEWDLTSLDATDRQAVAAWVRLHKEIRPLVADGTLVRPDHPDPGLVVTGMVSPDRREGVFVVAVTEATATQHPAIVRLAGLDPARRYRVTSVAPTADQHPMDLGESWMRGEGVVSTGGLLIGSGLQLPVTAPETAYVIRVTPVDGGPGDA